MCSDLASQLREVMHSLEPEVKAAIDNPQFDLIISQDIPGSTEHSLVV